MRPNLLPCVLLTAAFYGVSADAGSSAAIYRCEMAQLHELDLGKLNTHTPPAVRPSTEKPPSAKRAASVANAAKQAEICARLARDLREVRAKYRSGYSAKEGERLNEREAKLKAQLRSARCG
jgi:hypothetical protein